MRKLNAIFGIPVKLPFFFWGWHDMAHISPVYLWLIYW